MPTDEMIRDTITALTENVVDYLINERSIPAKTFISTARHLIDHPTLAQDCLMFIAADARETMERALGYTADDESFIGQDLARECLYLVDWLTVAQKVTAWIEFDQAQQA